MKFILPFLLFILVNSNNIEVKKNTLVLFKSSCRFCSEFQPVWDKLTDAYDSFLITIDCDLKSDVCKHYNIKEYPTLKYKFSHDYMWLTYENRRDFKTLNHFISNYIEDGCFEDNSLCTKDELNYINYLKQLTQSELEQKRENHNEKIFNIQSYFLKQEKALQEQYDIVRNNNSEHVLQERKNYSFITKENMRRDEL